MRAQGIEWRFLFGTISLQGFLFHLHILIRYGRLFWTGWGRDCGIIATDADILCPSFEILMWWTFKNFSSDLGLVVFFLHSSYRSNRRWLSHSPLRDSVQGKLFLVFFIRLHPDGLFFVYCLLSCFLLLSSRLLLWFLFTIQIERILLFISSRLQISSTLGNTFFYISAKFSSSLSFIPISVK